MIIALNQQHLTQLIYGKERVKSPFSVHWHVEWSLSESDHDICPYTSSQKLKIKNCQKCKI